MRPTWQVWLLRVDVTILNDDGNLEDCAMLACMAGLLHFRHRCAPAIMF